METESLQSGSFSLSMCWLPTLTLESGSSEGAKAQRQKGELLKSPLRSKSTLPLKSFYKKGCQEKSFPQTGEEI